MTTFVEGGPAIPVSVVTNRTAVGGAAIPVYGYTATPTDRPALGGPALPVKVLTSADLKQNGGAYYLEGRTFALPVYTAPSGTTVQGGPAIPVYPVNASAWPASSAPAPVVPWYLKGGVAAANCIAAYQPKGAASLAASYVNLANPGTYDVAPGTAPTFNAATGWTGNGTTMYLTTGVVPASGWSWIVRFSNAVSKYAALFGAGYATANTKFDLGPRSDAIVYENGGQQNVFPEVSAVYAGVMAAAGNQAYKDGVAQAGTIPAWAGVLTRGIYLLATCQESNGAVQAPSDATIQAIAFYDTVLSAPQVVAITAAMNLL